MQDITFAQVDVVNGGLGNFAAGAAVGAVTYGIGAAITGSFSWSGFGGAVVAGAVTSGFSALAGGGRAATFYFSGVGAAAGGSAHQAIWHYVEH